MEFLAAVGTARARGVKLATLHSRPFLPDQAGLVRLIDDMLDADTERSFHLASGHRLREALRTSNAEPPDRAPVLFFRRDGGVVYRLAPQSGAAPVRANVRRPFPSPGAMGGRKGLGSD